MRPFFIVPVLAALLVIPSSASVDAPPLKAPRFGPIAEPPQPDGDPEQGYHALVNAPIDTCGVPLRVVREQFGSHGSELAGREGENRTLPYFLTQARSRFGVDVATPNCLGCHASYLHGELTIGLGETGLDFTESMAPYSAASVLLARSWAEVQEWERYHERVQAIAPHIRLSTAGVTPADDIAAVLFAHRDPETFEWLSEPQYELGDEPVPLDVPALWHLRKKRALYYTGAGRGDHSRLMITATSFCADSVAEIQEIEHAYRNVRSYFASLEPPAWPYAINQRQARRGEELFEKHCASCHGTYGEEETYPNRLVRLSEIETDPMLATRSSVSGRAFVHTYNRSYFGEASRLMPAEGYVAPPLDGVWATAPYFHNGSVPTLRGVLNPDDRPSRYRRSDEYDRDGVGRRFRLAGPEDASPWVYDTEEPGYGNGGHDMARYLNDQERDAILEYLKTL